MLQLMKLYPYIWADKLIEDNLHGNDITVLSLFPMNRRLFRLGLMMSCFPLFELVS